MTDGFDSISFDTPVIEESPKVVDESPIIESQGDEVSTEVIDETEEVIEQREEIQELDSNSASKEEPKDTEEAQNVYDYVLDEDKPSEPEGDFNYKGLSEEIGLEFSNKDEFVDAIEQLRNSQSQELFADDDVKTHFDKINEIAKSGGDWKKYAGDFSTSQKKLEEVAALESHVGVLRSYLESSDISKKLEFLETDIKTDRSLSPEEKEESLEALKDATDSQITTLANRTITQAIRSREFERDSASRQAKSLQESIDNEAASLKAAEENALKEINNKIQSYKDPDSDRFTPKMKNALKKSMNSTPATYRIPSKLAEALFVTDGKLDFSKVAASLNAVTLGSEKKTIIERAAKKGFFRSLQEADARTSKTTGRKSSESKGSGFDEINW